MAKWYYMDEGVVKGPVLSSGLQKALWRGCLTRNTMVCKDGSNEWVSLGSVWDEACKVAKKQMQNECADNLLTVCVFVFFAMAIAQIVFGIVYLDDKMKEIGISLIFSSLGYIFPISIAYTVRQIFRNQLNGDD